MCRYARFLLLICSKLSIHAFCQHVFNCRSFFGQSQLSGGRKVVKKKTIPLFTRHEITIFSSATPENDDIQAVENSATERTEEEKKKEIGNLVADDEWMGLTMELADLVRVAVIEDTKKVTREFTGKDDYKLGDISKEIDSRVKDEVAKLREKDEYELGDLSIALDSLAKDMTCELSGKDAYEFGDLSKEVDSRVKGVVENFTGKPYEAGDLTREVGKRVSAAVEEFTGKDYEFGDVSRELERRRSEWVKEYLQKDDYQFGDITKKAIANFTGEKGGKEDYEFGDVTKKVLSNMFGKRKRGGEKNTD